MQNAQDASYQQFDPEEKTYARRRQGYFSQLGKAIGHSTIGTRSFRGTGSSHLVIAHTDRPEGPFWTCARPRGVTSPTNFSYFKTHY